MPPQAHGTKQASRRQQSIPEGREYSPLPENDPIMMPAASNMPPDMIPDARMMSNLDLGLDASYSWEMIGLGLEEPMPMQEAIDEL